MIVPLPKSQTRHPARAPPRKRRPRPVFLQDRTNFWQTDLFLYLGQNQNIYLIKRAVEAVKRLTAALFEIPLTPIQTLYFYILVSGRGHFQGLRLRLFLCI